MAGPGWAGRSGSEALPGQLLLLLLLLLTCGLLLAQDALLGVLHGGVGAGVLPAREPRLLKGEELPGQRAEARVHRLPDLRRQQGLAGAGASAGAAAA
jgi:hypothetical protein